MLEEAMSEAGQRESKGSPGVFVTRIAIGLTTLFTWFDNISKDFYDGDNFAQFFEDQFSESGNDSSLTFVKSILDATLLQAPEFFGWILTFFELGIAIGLLFGIFTRAAALAGTAFFFNLFLVYFGGEEWIWTYVLLTAAPIAVFLDWGGRFLGVDQIIAEAKGESPGGLLW